MDEGDRHPYDNDRFRWLHAQPIAFDVGDRVATRDYVLALERDGGGYAWDVTFTVPVEPGWIFLVSRPGGPERLPGYGE